MMSLQASSSSTSNCASSVCFATTFSASSVCSLESLHPLRQLGQLLLRDTHLAPQLRAPLLFGDLLSSLPASRRRNRILDLRQHRRARTEKPSQGSTLQLYAPKEESEQKRLEAGRCVSPWGIHLPHFLELPGCRCSRGARAGRELFSTGPGGKGELGRAVPQRKHVFLIGQHPDRKQPGQVHSPGIGETFREPPRTLPRMETTRSRPKLLTSSSP